MVGGIPSDASGFWPPVSEQKILERFGFYKKNKKTIKEIYILKKYQ